MAAANTIRFERLFEVHILHEFYLNNDNKRSYFSLDDNTRAAYLNELLYSDRYDIWKDISVEPSCETGKMLEDQHLRFVRTKTGFMIGTRVKYLVDKPYPFITAAPDAPFTFRIRINNPFFRNFSNLSLNTTLPSLYFFSNSNREGTKVFPSLSLPIEEFRSNKTYEQGEVIRTGNDILEAITRTSSSDAVNWRKITARGIAHEGDRILLPMRFRYTFESNSDVRQAVFTLKTIDGSGIKTIAVSGVEKLQQVPLDFRVDDSSARQEIKKGVYNLEITGDNGYQRQEKIILNPEQYNTRDLGMVEINYTAGDTGYDLLETDGSLKQFHPVFEIRLKSRITFWRYRSNSGLRLTATAKTSPFLTAENGALKSVMPVPMNAMPMEFLDEDPLIPGVFLPNPPGHSLRMEQNGMIYSDIYISGIKDLIVEEI